MIAQSGGMGFSFFDHGRAKELAFRYVVTTGNEACLETFDFADFILDEGKVAALLLLLEDVKSGEQLPAAWRRRRCKAGVPIIVNKIGQSEAGVRAAASHTAALAGSYDAYRAMFQRYGLIEGRDLGEMVDIAAGFLALGSRLPAGRRVGICTASGGGGGWMADACAAAGLEVPTLDAETRARIDAHLPAYGTSQNPVDATAQAVHKIGYAGLARLVADSPLVDGVIVVMTARNPANLERQREDLARLAAEARKPILMWSYTLPAPASVQLLSEAGYPAVHRHPQLRPHHAGDGRLPGAARAVPAGTRGAHSGRETDASAEVLGALAAAGAVLCEWEARPLLAAYGIGTNTRSIGRRAQTPPLPRQAGSGARSRSRCSRRRSRTRRRRVPSRWTWRSPEAVRSGFEMVLGNARRHAPEARILGVLVQPMAPPGREVILGVKRDATFGPMPMVGFGGVNVEVFKDIALAPLPLSEGGARDMLARLEGVPLLGEFRGRPAGGCRCARRFDGAARLVRRRPRRRHRRDRSQSRCWCTSAAGACRWWTP